MQSKIDYIKQALKEQKTIISFTGMHGCGKSTMLDKLSEVLEIPKLIEPCRLLLPALKEGLLDVNFFQKFSFWLYRVFWTFCNKKKSSFICDRIIRDIIAYWELTESQTPSKECNRFKYDIVIRLNELPIDESKPRRDFTEKQEMQLRVNLINGIENTQYKHFLDINSNNFDERFSMIIDYLYKYFGGEIDSIS